MRDRNHASVVAWGLLNETGGDKLFYHAVASLPFVRALDSSRMIVLNSGRSDGIAAIGSLSNPGSGTWDISQRHLLDLHLYATVPISREQLDILRTGEHPERIWGVYGNLQPEEVQDAAVYISEYYRADRWAKKHAIFDGLPTGGMLNYRFYRNIISPLALSQDYTVFVGGVLERGTKTQLDRPSKAVCGAIRTSYEYGSGLHIGVWDFGAGRFIVNTLRIRENLGTDPAAERLLRNMLNYAARGLDNLPADFDQQLKAIGYEGT